jgi:DAACS family dicarboxylate/amino acid:cation (Na+ or H+) symporter
MRLELHWRILIGAAVGVVAGIIAHDLWAGADSSQGARDALAWTLSNVTGPVGQVFLRLLFMLVLPLMFAALVLGVSEFRDLRSVGRIGLRTLACTVVISSIAVLLGVTLVNVARPGEGMDEATRVQLVAEAAADVARERGEDALARIKAPPPRASDLLVRIVPDNPVRAAADGDYLGWMFFSLLIGLGLCLVRTEAAGHLRRAIQGLFDVSMRLIELVIALAPIGVAALLFTTTAQFGGEWLLRLGQYMLVVLAALAIHQFVVYSLAVRLLGGMSPRQFFRDVQPAMLTAFSTASSNATLPTTLQVAENSLRLPPHVSRFVLTLGATANQNGTALFEGVTVLFLAQLYGVELTFGQQITVVLMCILGGIGTAGVPAGSIPVVAMILGVVDVPKEGIALILGVDRLLDMCRTTLNVTGDLAVAVIVARAEPEPAKVA